MIPRNPRVLLVTGYYDPFSGYLEVVLARELARTCQVRVVCGNRVSPTFGDAVLERLGVCREYPPGESADGEVQLTRLPYAKVGSLLLPDPRRLRRALTAAPADLVLVLGVGQGFSVPAAFRPAPAARATIFGDNRAQWSTLSPRRQLLKSLAFAATKGVLYATVMRRCDPVYANTPNTATRLARFHPHRELSLLPLGADPAVFGFAPQVRAQERVELELGASPTLAVVGKPVPEKRLELAVEAFRSVCERTGARLVLAGLGDDDYSRSLRELVRSDPVLRERTVLLGFLQPPELARLLQAVDVAVWPKQPAITIQQAIVSGVRVVVPDDDLVGFLTDGGRFGTAFGAGRDALARALATELAEVTDDRTRADRVAAARWLTTPVIAQRILRDCLPETADG